MLASMSVNQPRISSCTILRASDGNMGLPIAPGSLAGRLSKSSTTISDDRGEASHSNRLRMARIPGIPCAIAVFHLRTTGFSAVLGRGPFVWVTACLIAESSRFCGKDGTLASFVAVLRDCQAQGSFNLCAGCARCQCSATSRPVQNQTRSCFRTCSRNLISPAALAGRPINRS